MRTTVIRPQRAILAAAMFISMFLVCGAPSMVFAATGTVDDDTVIRRGAQPPLTGTIATIDDAGVLLRRSTGAEYFLTWDRIRSIESSTPRPGVRTRLQRGEDLWRARTRLERHDARLAEPLFDRLFEHYRGQTNETALIVAEGVYRCRIARADHSAALLPALEILRITDKGISADAFIGLPPIIDDAYGLCINLAPVWVDDESLPRLVRELESYDPQGSDFATACKRIYLHALQRQVDMPLTTFSDDISSEVLTTHAGVALLHDLVRCFDADVHVESSIIDRLSELLSDDASPEWVKAWAHLGIGHAMLHSTDRDRQLRGVVQLLNIPAQRQLMRHQYLAGLALVHAAQALDELDESEAATVLRDELHRTFPRHPAVNLRPQSYTSNRSGILRPAPSDKDRTE